MNFTETKYYPTDSKSIFIYIYAHNHIIYNYANIIIIDVPNLGVNIFWQQNIWKIYDRTINCLCTK